MNFLEAQLQHLIRLATREPWMNNHAHAEWKGYAWKRATALAAQYPEDYADLPRRLTEAMQAGSNGSGLAPRSTDSTEPP